MKRPRGWASWRPRAFRRSSSTSCSNRWRSRCAIPPSSRGSTAWGSCPADSRRPRSRRSWRPKGRATRSWSTQPASRSVRNDRAHSRNCIMRIWHQSFTGLDDLPDYRAAMEAHIRKVVRPDTEVVMHGLIPGTYTSNSPGSDLAYGSLYTIHGMQWILHAVAAPDTHTDVF